MDLNGVVGLVDQSICYGFCKRAVPAGHKKEKLLVSDCIDKIINYHRLPFFPVVIKTMLILALFPFPCE